MMTRLQHVCAVLGAACATLVSSLAIYSPGGPSYSVGIPSTSTISATSAGSLYIQIVAPITYQWVAMGIGGQMAGATIFLVYADGAGNVTVSVRDGGPGHVEPQLDSALQAGLTLLEGSGIVGKNMVANILCTTCKLQSSSTATSSDWIAAWFIGSAVDSTSTSYNVNQHSQENTRQYSLDLTGAAMAYDSNPFLSTSASTSASPSTATATSAGAVPSTTSKTSIGVTIGNSPQKIARYDKAHGIVMSTVVVLLFPIGAIIMRVGGSMNAHRGVQLLSLVAMVAGLGLGIKLAQMRNYLFKGTGTAHTIFGVIIVALFLIQPVFGILHHNNYLKHQSRTAVSYAHIWYGRLIMVLAVINGGLGLRLAANSKNGKIAYEVVAGVMGLAYISATVFKRKGTGNMNDERVKGMRGSADEVGSEELQQVIDKP